MSRDETVSRHIKPIYTTRDKSLWFTVEPKSTMLTFDYIITAINNNHNTKVDFMLGNIKPTAIQLNEKYTIIVWSNSSSERLICFLRFKLFEKSIVSTLREKTPTISRRINVIVRLKTEEKGHFSGNRRQDQRGSNPGRMMT